MLLWLWLLLTPFTTSNVRGQVVAHDDGRPLPDVHVVVRVEGSAFVQRVSTGADGRFEVQDVPPGMASLSIERYPYV